MRFTGCMAAKSGSALVHSLSWNSSVFLIQMASSVLFHQFCSCSKIFTPSQSTACPSSQACTATPSDFQSSLRICTLSLLFDDLPVLFILSHSHSREFQYTIFFKYSFMIPIYTMIPHVSICLEGQRIQTVQAHCSSGMIKCIVMCNSM